MATSTLSVTRTNGIAGQIILSSRDSADATRNMAFSGSAYGTPGPVFALVGDMQVKIDGAGRYGERFDADWVRTFFAKTDEDRALKAEALCA